MEAKEQRKRRKKKRKRVLNIFVYSEGEKFGPLTKDGIRKELLTGAFKLSDLAWHNRLPNWVTLDALPKTKPHETEKYAMPRIPENAPLRSKPKRRSNANAASRSWHLLPWLLQIFRPPSKP